MSAAGNSFKRLNWLHQRNLRNRLNWLNWLNRPASPQAALGWTLLELMVVLALIGLATAAVSLAFRDPNAAQVEEDALRLAALLESARAHSRSTGLPVRWQVAPDGFRFEGLQGLALPQTWKHAGVQAQVEEGEVLLLGPEPVLAPQAVLVASRAAPARRWRVATDGVRPFGVQPAMGGP